MVILSAKYGLLMPDDWIEPYDLTLKSMSKKQRMTWADRVIKKIKERLDLTKVKKAYFHCGKEYREFLIPRLKECGIINYIPLKDLVLESNWHGIRKKSVIWK